MPMRTSRKILVTLLAISLLSLGTGLPAPATAETPPVLKQLDEAFGQVAEKVTPAVVNISSTKKMTAAPSGENGEQFPKDFPFRDFFGDDFFKHFKGQPQQPGGARQVAMGSGVIMSSDGLILTNAHVVKDMDEIKVTLSGHKTFVAKLKGIDPESDIAVIKIDAKGLPSATFGDSSKLRVGQLVLAIGNPFGLNRTVTSGIVSATGRTNVGIIDYEDFVQTDAAINPGNSGGPLVNTEGQVVGITTAIASRSGGYQGIGFAIPSNSAKLVMDELLKEGKVRRGLLGVNIQDVDDALAKSFGLSDINGALVSQVEPGSPAEKAGIKSGDFIIKYRGQPVSGAAQLKNLVGQDRPGTSAQVTFMRNKKTEEVSLVIGERTPKAVAKAEEGSGGMSDELGISVEPVPAGVAKKMHLKHGEGMLVKQVKPDSAAANMGLQTGDVILEVDGKAVSDVGSFSKEVEAAKQAKVIRVRLQRGQATLYLATTLG
jgi:serine protease Do